MATGILASCPSRCLSSWACAWGKPPWPHLQPEKQLQRGTAVWAGCLELRVCGGLSSPTDRRLPFRTPVPGVGECLCKYCVLLDSGRVKSSSSSWGEQSWPGGLGRGRDWTRLTLNGVQQGKHWCTWSARGRTREENTQRQPAMGASGQRGTRRVGVSTCPFPGPRPSPTACRREGRSPGWPRPCCPLRAQSASCVIWFFSRRL